MLRFNQEVSKGVGEFGIARHARETSERRCAELSDLLLEQRTTNSVILEKFNQTLALVASKQEPAKRKTAAGDLK